MGIGVVRKARGEVRPIERRIRVREQNFELAEKIAKSRGVSIVASRILAARGFEPGEKLEHFLNPSLQSGLPHPSKLLNIDLAVGVIVEAINRGEQIAIACDFDVDGLSGGSQLHHFLKSVGAKSAVFVPDRFSEGYGLNQGMIEKIAKAGFKVLVAIDFGTTNQGELQVAKTLGLRTVVVDHHHVSEVPTVDAFINPQQSGCGFADGILSASGLVWYLVVALRSALKTSDSIDAKSYLDLACLGTICDMVPLIGANRVIAKRGLETLSTSARTGLIALKNVAGFNGKVSCSNVSFGLGPRINAAGRMVHGEIVIDLLTTDDSVGAAKIAQKLNRLNEERQSAEERLKNDAIEKIMNFETLPEGLVVWDRAYHTGVVGIVAQRLVETFYRPSVVLGSDGPGILKGSVRGVKGFNVVEALNSVGEQLIKFGGHSGAGGLSIHEENIEQFREAFIAECKKRLSAEELKPIVDADTEADLPDVDVALVKELSQFAPFGMGNPAPVLMLRNLRVQSTTVLKNAHLKVTLSDGKRFIKALMWKRSSHPDLVAGRQVDLACRAEINTFRGDDEVQIIIQGVTVSSALAAG